MADAQGSLTAPRRRLAQAGLVAWVVAWMVIGGVTAVQIRNLGRVSDTLTESGQALDTAGRALQAIGQAPVIGEAPRRLGDEVREAAGEIQASGTSSRRTIRWLSVLLGLSIVLIPISSVAGWYLPGRISASRQRRAVEQALAGGQGDQTLERFLAHRAVQNLPFDTLRRVSPDPWADLEEGSYRRLANAELTRLGLATRPRSRTTRSLPASQDETQPRP